MDAAWKLAQSLERRFGIKHFMKGPPAVNVTVTSNLHSTLNRNLWRQSRSRYIDDDFFPEGSTVFSQQNLVAPEPNILNGRSGAKRKSFVQQLEM